MKYVYIDESGDLGNKYSSSKYFVFAGIMVDGVKVEESLYDAEEGSVIVKLKPEYLETLAEGEHTLAAMFDDGEGKAKFTIKPALPSELS